MAASEDDAVIVCASTILMGYTYRKLLVKDQTNKKKRSVWVNEWLAERGTKGAYNYLVVQLMLTDAHDNRQFMRMNVDSFQVIRSLFLQETISYEK